MGTPLSDPRKTKVIAIQDRIDPSVIHLYGIHGIWLTSMVDDSFMEMFGEWAHASIYHPDAGSSKIEMELFVESETK